MAHVEVAPGVQIHVVDVGEGPAVVLVPGFGMPHEAFDRQIRVLAGAGCRVIAVDQRGHGASDKPVDGYDVERLAADLVAVIEAVDAGPAAVAGWSFGGQVAFKAAVLRPDLVSRLVLIGSNAVRASRSEEFPFGLLPEQTVPAMIEMEHRDRFAARRTTIRSGFGAEPDPAVLDWMTTQSLRMPSWAAVACYHSMLETDLVADLPAITMPVLQIIGENDPVHSARGAAWLEEQLADARLVTLPACGHYPMFEAADALDEQLLGFLAPRQDRGVEH